MAMAILWEGIGVSSFSIGGGQLLAAEDNISLLAGVEAVVDFCLAEGSVLAVFTWNDSFCQVHVDSDNDMHVESSFGSLAKHAGLSEPVEGYAWLSGNRLPSDWPARAKMTAGAITRAFIHAGGMTFPAELSVVIMGTETDTTNGP